MSAFGLSPALLNEKADYEFFVDNWPERLQRASHVERRLLALMRHPCYRLLVRTDEQGIERLHVKPSPGMPSPVTDEARAYIRDRRHDLIAWVKRTDVDRARLREVGL
ncbi:MAG: hypothetical protein KC438_15495 [Thermomicrobiales bacterium]|nr:hypothetical protein [Thermomicrobiales bacterium]